MSYEKLIPWAIEVTRHNPATSIIIEVEVLPIQHADCADPDESNARDLLDCVDDMVNVRCRCVIVLRKTNAKVSFFLQNLGGA